MVQNTYHIHLIAYLFDQFNGAKYFTKLNLRSWYYQVRIARDELKTTCDTRYEAFEFSMMSFGLTNALATFYLDDILVYSSNLKKNIWKIYNWFFKS